MAQTSLEADLLCQLVQGAPGSPSPILFYCHPQATFLFSLIKYTPLTYNKKYMYPWWGDALGWLLALSSMVCIPTWSFYKLSTLKGSLREVGKHPEDGLGSPCWSVAARLGGSWYTGGPGILVQSWGGTEWVLGTLRKRQGASETPAMCIGLAPGGHVCGRGGTSTCPPQLPLMTDASTLLAESSPAHVPS